MAGLLGVFKDAQLSATDDTIDAQYDLIVIDDEISDCFDLVLSLPLPEEILVAFMGALTDAALYRAEKESKRNA